MQNLEVLRAPLAPEEIEWKVIASKNGWTTLAPFIDARAVMERLDRAFGPFGWQVRYTPAQVGRSGGHRQHRDPRPRVREWVEKQDGSGPTDMEPFKGASPGPSSGRPWPGASAGSSTATPGDGGGEHRFVPFKVLERLKGLTRAFNEGKPLPEVVRLKEDGTDYRKAA